MDDALSEERIANLRKACDPTLVRCRFCARWGTDHTDDCHIHDLRALLAERDAWKDDTHPTSLRGQWMELRRRRAEVDATCAKLERDHASLHAERDALLKVAEANLTRGVVLAAALAGQTVVGGDAQATRFVLRECGVTRSEAVAAGCSEQDIAVIDKLDAWKAGKR